MTSEQTGNFTDPAAFSSNNVASLDILSINDATLFDIEQCRTIVDSCIAELWLPTSSAANTSALHTSKRQKLRGDVEGFPFLNIRDVTKNANTTTYDFNLIGIIDQDFPQVFSYSEGDFYNWHIDLSVAAPSRKLTFIINLSDPAECEGGELEFLNVDTSQSNTSAQGHCLVFPSYTPYRITPVSKGHKHVIIGHVHGAVFK
jgi:predicted 2-oxoglutarate/Fe(II)-dependent dioxygenase YbiX